MAKIPVEKESHGGGWWKWLLALLLLGGLIWLLVAVLDTDEPEPVDVGVTDVPVTADTARQQTAGLDGMTVGAILANPDQYFGESFPAGEVTVASDREITDRGFWIQGEGGQLFAVIIDQPQEQPKDINPGATLSLDEGTLRRPDDLATLPGVPLDQDTEDIARQQEIFLVVDERNIQVLEQGTPQEGTDSAQAVQ